MAELQKYVWALTFTLMILPVLAGATTVSGRNNNDGQDDDSSTAVSYRAAATQYTPSSDWQLGAEGILEENFNTILQLAQNASLQGADIIVLPEYGLTGTDLGQNSSLFRGLCQVVPNPADGRVPCTEEALTENYWMVQSLSCLALQLNMYIVVDLSELVLPLKFSMKEDAEDSNINVDEAACPSSGEEQNGSICTDGLCPDAKSENFESSESSPREENAEDFIAYNTQVVFDRAGAVVARYRKKHLFFEPEFEYGYEDDSTALFTTDFGVTFTLQVCFDIMYSSPAVANVVKAGVRDIAMSTAWIDELPFLTAPQIFRGFSRGLSSNLIVSNLFNPSAGEVGSGIFHGDHSKGHKYTYDSNVNEPVLILDDLTTEVDGSMWMNFIEKQKLLTTKLVTKILKSFSESKSVIGEFENILGRQEILQNTLISNVGGLFKEARLLRRNITYLRKVLDALFSSMRQVVEWERFSNKQKCSEICKKVQFLLEEGKSAETGHVARPGMLDDSAYKQADVEGLDTSGAVNQSFINSMHDFKSDDTVTSHESKNYQFIIHENISFYAHEVLPLARNVSVVSCYDSFCCEVWYTFLDDMENATASTSAYMLLAYNGTVAKGGGTYWMWTQVCGVVFCIDKEDVNSCAAVDEPKPDLNSGFRLRNITGNFQTSVIFPSVFDLNFQLVNYTLWSYSTMPGQLLLDGDVDNLLTAVLFGRKYSLDP